MEKQLEQLETKINLILEYTLQKEKSKISGDEYYKYLVNNSRNDRSVTKVEIYEQNYTDSLLQLKNITDKIEYTLRLKNLEQLTKQAQELEMGY